MCYSALLILVSQENVTKHLNRWTSFHNTVHFVSQKCACFSLCYKSLIRLYSWCKDCPVAMVCGAGSDSLRRAKGVAAFLFARVTEKNLQQQALFSSACKGHIKQSLGKILGQSRAKGRNLDSHLSQADIPSTGLKSCPVSLFLPPSPRDPLDLPTELNVSEKDRKFALSPTPCMDW